MSFNDLLNIDDLKLYSIAISNHIGEFLLLKCYERYKTEASTHTSYMMLSSSPGLYKRTKVHKVLLFCAFVRKQTTILHIILYFKLLEVERRGPHRKIRGFTSSIVAI